MTSTANGVRTSRRLRGQKEAPMTTPNMIIRPASLLDIHALARLHIDGRRATYKGIMSDDILNSLTCEKAAERFSGLINTETVFVAVDPQTSEVTGFSIPGARRDAVSPHEGEVHALGVHPVRHRSGIGRRLMTESAIFLSARGFTRMTVWTLTINPARGFYEKLGGAFTGERDVEVKGQLKREASYSWDVASFLKQHAPSITTSFPSP
jgi:ribosomal protein S18 acetylase RimI-like enzyme